MGVSEEELFKTFLVQNVIFNPKFYELAQKYDDEELLYFFDELKIILNTIYKIKYILKR